MSILGKCFFFFFFKSVEVWLDFRYRADPKCSRDPALAFCFICLQVCHNAQKDVIFNNESVPEGRRRKEGKQLKSEDSGE